MENGQISGGLEYEVPVSGVPENGHDSSKPAKRKPGRPPGKRKVAEQGQPEQRAPRRPSRTYHGASTEQADLDGERAAPDEEKVSPFSTLLRNILRHEHAEVSRVAGELDVAENTIYRWMSGSSVPRPMHLKRLPDVLPEHRSNLAFAINQTFPGTLDVLASPIPEVSKDIYYQVLDLVYTIEEPENRFWRVCHALFDYALLLLDAERHGMAITYAALMPPQKDGIHSLRESIMRGTHPWPHSFESKVFLGSTTLAGDVASLQRTRIWDAADKRSRLLVEVDENEASACATPIMRGGRISGVLIASSARAGFFNDAMACKAIEELAHLLATALLEADFYPYTALRLRPMPPLPWQREQLAQSYVSRILTYARRDAISRAEAERRAQSEIELEFEEYGRTFLDQQRKELE